MSAYRESEFLRTTAGTRPDACTRGFLARLHAGLLEVALVTQRLDDALLVEDLLQTLETAFNGFALFQLQLDRHACFTSLSKLSDLRGPRKVRVVYHPLRASASPIPIKQKLLFLVKLNATSVVASTRSQAGDATGGIELFPTGKESPSRTGGLTPSPMGEGRIYF